MTNTTDAREFTAGDPIITTARLGLTDDPNATRFVDDVAEAGTAGTYVGPHPARDQLGDDWHIVAVTINGRDLYAPLHSTHFDPAPLDDAVRILRNLFRELAGGDDLTADELAGITAAYNAHRSGGAVVAAVALGQIMGTNYDWPTAMRREALSSYGLSRAWDGIERAVAERS